jgi:hypothetical protein
MPRLTDRRGRRLIPARIGWLLLVIRSSRRVRQRVYPSRSDARLFMGPASVGVRLGGGLFGLGRSHRIRKYPLTLTGHTGYIYYRMR